MGAREVDTDDLAIFGLLVEMGGQCVLLVLGGCAIGLLAGGAIGAMAGFFGARPLLRWGLGNDPTIGCIAVAVLVFGGLVGGIWAGAWGGASLCAEHAISEKYVVEDLVLVSVVLAATEGEPGDDPAYVARRINEAVQEAGGSLRLLLEEVNAEVRMEAPDAVLPEFLSPEMATALLEELDRNALFRPKLIARIAIEDGLVAAAGGADEELARYARELMSVGEPIRREILFAIHAAVISNAVITFGVALLAPLAVMLLIAGVSRLIRSSGRRQEPV